MIQFVIINQHLLQALVQIKQKKIKGKPGIMYLSARNNSRWVGLHGAELRDVVGQLLPGDEPDVFVLHVCHIPVSCKNMGRAHSYGLFSRLQVAPPPPPPVL